MSDSSPGTRAVSSYEIEDVFVVNSYYRVDREFNPTSQLKEFMYGHQSGMEKEVLVQTRNPIDGGEAIHILRYYVHTELRILKPGVQVDEKHEPAEGDFLAVLRFTFAADYRCPEDCLKDKEAIGAFGRNAYYHAYPYMRAEVHAACARLRLPRITLPMLRTDKLGKMAFNNQNETLPSPKKQDRND